MSRKTTDIYLEAKKIWGTAIQAGPPGKKELELQLELHKRLLHIFQAGGYYYMVFNVYQMELEYISADITNVLGYTPDEVNAMFFLDRIHPDDKSYFLSSETKLTEFLKQLPLAKRGSYKIQHDYRIKTKNNNYVRLLHQILPIEYDENNYYRSLVLHTDITHIKPVGTPSFSIIGLDGEPSYHNIQHHTVDLSKSEDPFTKREREILKYIIEGKNSKEIAKELYLSLHTVNTHRKNILLKADCRSPVDLVIKAIEQGWV